MVGGEFVQGVTPKMAEISLSIRPTLKDRKEAEKRDLDQGKVIISHTGKVTYKENDELKETLEGLEAWLNRA